MAAEKSGPEPGAREDWSQSAFSLEGMTAVVTGGGRGIGNSIARGLSKAGARVVLLDLIEDGHTDGFQTIRCDVSDERLVEAAFDKVEAAIGLPEILVNNAGINALGPAATYPTSSWTKVLGTNLNGAFFCARRVGARLIQAGRPGRIINIASVMGHVGPSMHNAVAYSAAKAGMLGLTRALAVEWAANGINVNAICPGMILTELTASRMDDSEYERKMRQRIPGGRFGQPSDLVGTAIFLASPASSLITGHALNVDAGWMAA